MTWPDPRLAQPCAPVGDPASVAALIDDLFDTMYAAPGRGLAAPQVGAMQRVFVMDIGWKQGAPTPLVCIDPRILTASDDTATGPEGCLSMPGITAQVTRATRITLAFTAPDGSAQRRDLDGFAAICAQHELDHLDGRMHFDHLGPAARAALLAEYRAPA
nr:peptide deformylase [Thalassococcus arenae]